MMGTGWLVRPDLVITAGHVIYDWGYHLGATSQMKCYIGYNGRESVLSPTVQTRFGRLVMTPAEWLQTSDNRRQRDVAFVKLDRPFTGDLQLFRFVNTPSSARALLGVVGYPGDRILQDRAGRSETGAQMYEMFKETDYDLEKNELNMIEYQISTFRGQTGAPVLRQDGRSLVSIGCHTYGGGGYRGNSGTSIGGRYGNDFEAFINVLSEMTNTGAPGKIILVDTKPPRGNDMEIPIRQPTRAISPSAQNQSAREGYIQDAMRNADAFSNTMKEIAAVGQPGVKSNPSPLLSPVGKVTSTVAGALLRILVRSDNAPFRETTYEGIAERAVLAEAALQAVLNLQQSDVKEELMGKMRKIWVPTNTKMVARAILPLITESAFETAVSMLEAQLSSDVHRRSQFVRCKPLIIGPILARQGLDPLSKALLQVSNALTEVTDFLGGFDNYFVKAVSTVDPLVAKTAARSSLSRQTGSATDQGEEAVNILIQRSLMADVALQALAIFSLAKLEQLEANPVAGGGTPDNIIDCIISTVRDIGVSTIKKAETVIAKSGPIISVVKAPGSELGLVGSTKSIELDRQPFLMDMLTRLTNLLKVSYTRDAAGQLIDIDVGSLLQAREREWALPTEWRSDWDDNDDGLFPASTPPPGI